MILFVGRLCRGGWDLLDRVGWGACSLHLMTRCLWGRGDRVEVGLGREETEMGLTRRRRLERGGILLDREAFQGLAAGGEVVRLGGEGVGLVVGGLEVISFRGEWNSVKKVVNS